MKKIAAFSGVLAALLVVCASAGASHQNAPGAVSSTPQSLGPMWNVTFGDYYNEAVNDIAVDATGIYAVGTTNVMAPDPMKIFVTKYSFDGQELWTDFWGNNSNDVGSGIATAGGYVYVSGTTALGAANDSLVIKYDQNGNEIWNSTSGRAGYFDSATDIAVTDFIYTVGRSDKYGNMDAYAMKWDLDGNPIDGQFFGGAGTELAEGVAADGTGVYLCGRADTPGNEQVMAMMLDFNLTENWTSEWGGSQSDVGHHIVIDSSHLYISADTRSYTQGLNDFALVKFSKNGTCVANATWGDVNEDSADGIAIYGTDVFVCGEYGKSSDPDAVVVKFGTDMTFQWARAWDVYGYQNAAAVCVDTDGITLGGSYSMPMQLDDDALLLRTKLDGTNVPDIALPLAAIAAAAAFGAVCIAGIRRRE